MDIAVKTTNLYKTFETRESSMTMFRALSDRFLGKHTPVHELVAIRDLSVEILAGEKVALVGNNGAGKSTLLRILARLYRPSRGELVVKGRVALLAGFGLGMVDELSVTENVFLYGAIYGLKKRTIESAFDEILDWAELREFAKAKLRTLSSGMKARLAFSTLRHIDAEIFLFDEALVAGDQNFREKCEEHFREARIRDKTLILATHNLDSARSICDKTLWLHHGNAKEFGASEETVEHYKASRRHSAR